MAIDRPPLPRYGPLPRLLRHYTSIWCFAVVAMPIAVTRFGLIPVYESQKSLLPAYASFFCLLALAYVFSQRHRMARAMFAPRLLWTELDPSQNKQFGRMSINSALACMILGALSCAALYLWAFEAGRPSSAFPLLPPSSGNAVLLAISFITMFLLAEAAFAIIAVREHLQDVLGLTDAEVITGVPRAPASAAAPVPVPTRSSPIAAFSDKAGTRGMSDEGTFKSEVERATTTNF